MDILLLDECMMIDKILDILSCRVDIVDEYFIIFSQRFLEIFPSGDDPIDLMRLEDD